MKKRLAMSASCYDKGARGRGGGSEQFLPRPCLHLLGRSLQRNNALEYRRTPSSLKDKRTGTAVLFDTSRSHFLHQIEYHPRDRCVTLEVMKSSNIPHEYGYTARRVTMLGGPSSSLHIPDSPVLAFIGNRSHSARYAPVC